MKHCFTSVLGQRLLTKGLFSSGFACKSPARMKLVFKTLSFNKCRSISHSVGDADLGSVWEEAEVGNLFKFDNIGCEARSVLAKSWASDNKWFYPP